MHITRPTESVPAPQTAQGRVVFLLVSGYIITQVLQRERAGEFLLRRIYPLYIAAVLTETLLAAAVLGQPVPPLPEAGRLSRYRFSWK